MIWLTNKSDPRTSSILARFSELRELIRETVCWESFPEYHFPEHRVPSTIGLAARRSQSDRPADNRP
jgi:hypothetical protein